ncbi:MAG: alpha-D-ribose 1-methylphosphonate 5-triphosphate diphosphatase [Alphaproteobacteria bacterium]|jgi:alpha-D-ribose 1-methylphosphonate 5-triphosphate diphosphatase|nr:alpha-D-ribose 1-methylphosphonate 5-triphosphate diphosphatase [Alphaproteobacteria bacterium]
MSNDLIITNARIVTRGEIVDGSVHVVGGAIEAIDDSGSSLPAALDFEGDYLLPGLVEMHTDNVEKHFVPRPGIMWPAPMASLNAHDTQIAGAGITTVLNAVAVGDYRDRGIRPHILKSSIEAIGEGYNEGLLRAEHFLHLRCEVSDPTVLDTLAEHIDDPLVVLLSVMDHTPGQRQWRDLAKLHRHNRDQNWSDEDFRAFVDKRLEYQKAYSDKNRSAIAELCRTRGLPLASHDDTTEGHVLESVAAGVTICEFPCERPAAIEARKEGLGIVMGAPNVVLGGSHSGNVSALELAADGLLDGVSSDYMPTSLLHSAFVLQEALEMPLPTAVAKASCNVADLLGLGDRGEIAADKRADLVRVRQAGDTPIVRTVWREGIRVA